MTKKNIPDTRGFVYSTNPDFKFENEQETGETLSPDQQKLKIKLDTKHRAGKAVTLASVAKEMGFSQPQALYKIVRDVSSRLGYSDSLFSSRRGHGTQPVSRN